MIIDLKKLDSYSADDLQNAKFKIHNAWVKLTYPLSYKAFEEMSNFLKDKGFDNIEGKDEKCFTNGTHSVFNCPHICNSFEIYFNNPEMNRSNLSTKNGGYKILLYEKGFGVDFTEEQYKEFIEKAKELLKEVIIETNE